tara:strand:+ start:1602 stop:2723 length:1122 start_codon:yes stop_codon:yes gene_type:complete
MPSRVGSIAQVLGPAILFMTLALPAAGQQSYQLDEHDTWELESSPKVDSPEGRLASARRILAEGRAGRALNLIERWIERNPRSQLMAEAMVLKGDALVALHDEYEALYEYEYVVRRYPSSPAFTTALTREYDIAVQYAHGLRRKVLGLRIMSATEEAEELFIRIQERLPGSQLAEQAGLELADLYFRQRRMGLAADMYALFIKKYPRSPSLDTARRRLIYANLATFKGPEFDAVGLLEAKAELRQLIATHPAEAERIGARALIMRITESEAQKLLTTALWYERVGDPIAAEFAIRNLVERYPESGACVRALELIPVILGQLPEHVIKGAPDYSILRQAILGSDDAPIVDAVQMEDDIRTGQEPTTTTEGETAP